MVTLYIDQQGTVEGIYSDSLANLLTQGKAEVRRASHVEPGVDDKGKTCWYADMSPLLKDKFPLREPDLGDILGPFYTRKEALENEVEWINQYFQSRGS